MIGPSLQLFLNNTLVAGAVDSVLTSGSVGMRDTAGVAMTSFTATAASREFARPAFAFIELTFGSNGTLSSGSSGEQLEPAGRQFLGDLPVERQHGHGRIGGLNVATVNGVNAANVSVSAGVNLSRRDKWAAWWRGTAAWATSNMYWGALQNTGPPGYTAYIFRNVNGALDGVDRSGLQRFRPRER